MLNVQTIFTHLNDKKFEEYNHLLFRVICTNNKINLIVEEREKLFDYYLTWMITIKVFQRYQNRTDEDLKGIVKKMYTNIIKNNELVMSLEKATFDDYFLMRQVIEGRIIRFILTFNEITELSEYMMKLKAFIDITKDIDSRDIHIQDTSYIELKKSIVAVQINIIQNVFNQIYTQLKIQIQIDKATLQNQVELEKIAENDVKGEKILAMKDELVSQIELKDQALRHAQEMNNFLKQNIDATRTIQEDMNYSVPFHPYRVSDYYPEIRHQKLEQLHDMDAHSYV